MPIVAGITRSVARAVIPQMFTGGYSATAALTYFRGIGGQVRTKTWYADWREIAGIKKLERTYRFIPRKYRLSYQMMAPTKTHQDRAFKYIFDVHGKDSLTGEHAIRTMSYGSDTRYSPDEVTDIYTKIMDAEAEWYEELYNFVPDYLELAVVTRRIT